MYDTGLCPALDTHRRTSWGCLGASLTLGNDFLTGWALTWVLWVQGLVEEPRRPPAPRSPTAPTWLVARFPRVAGRVPLELQAFQTPAPLKFRGLDGRLEVPKGRS